VSKKEVQFTRKQYMDGDVSHDEYYGQFVTDGVIRLLDQERVKASTDPHFNDIPLHRWDQLATLLPHNVISAVCDANESTHAGKRVHSLSDCVCVLKAAAKKVRETEQRA
jgi:hypothetical protein